MENQHFLDEKELNIGNERPTFLTVLCIITFVVSGFFLLYSIFSAITYDENVVRQSMEIQISEIEESPELSENPMAKKIADGLIVTSEEEIANHTLLTLIGFISLILSLLGAYFMYNLKKIGFHLYTLSKIIALVPLLIYTVSLVVGIGYFAIGFFSLAFIIMYSRNLKYMS